jgi:phospholipid/cholesterol/gamma-HCH transport system substrate-binding protein
MKRMRMRMAGGIALALVLSGCSFNGIYDIPLPGKKVGEDDGFLVRADFNDALNVVPRSSVMVADVPIGQVESVTRVGWHARVTMRIRNDVDLPDNAEAQIRQTSLLGEKYVALSAPKSASGEKSEATGRLGEGDVIPMDNTGRNPEVEEVLGALSVVLSGGGVGQLQTITQELNQMMEGRTGKLRSVLGEVNTLVGTLDSQRGDIVQAMDSINGLSKTLIAEKKTIGDAIDAAGPAIDALRDQHKELVGMLTELDKLGDVGTRVINKTKDNLIAELRHLEPVLRKLSDNGDIQSSAPSCPECSALVPGLVAAAGYPFPIDAGDAIHGDFANVVFQFQVKLTPISEGGLLPTTLEDLNTLCLTTPLAPICSPLGDGIDRLCSVLGSIPLCSQEGSPGGLLGDVLGDAGADSSGGAGAPALPGLSPDPGGGTTTPPAGSPVQRLLDGLLGGARGGGSS